MNTLNYKNFIGTVSFSAEADVFHGKIEGINALVTFEGSSVEELKKAFHGAVDDYIALCEAEGIEPHKTFSGSFNIRIPSELHRQVALRAIKEGCSLNNYIKKIIEKAIQNKDSK